MQPMRPIMLLGLIRLLRPASLVMSTRPIGPMFKGGGRGMMLRMVVAVVADAQDAHKPHSHQGSRHRGGQ
jgi:hypothetical protein